MYEDQLTRSLAHDAEVKAALAKMRAKGDMKPDAYFRQALIEFELLETEHLLDEPEASALKAASVINYLLKFIEAIRKRL